MDREVLFKIVHLIQLLVGEALNFVDHANRLREGQGLGIRRQDRARMLINKQLRELCKKLVIIGIWIAALSVGAIISSNEPESNSGADPTKMLVIIIFFTFIAGCAAFLVGWFVLGSDNPLDHFNVVRATLFVSIIGVVCAGGTFVAPLHNSLS